MNKESINNQQFRMWSASITKLISHPAHRGAVSVSASHARAQSGPASLQRRSTLRRRSVALMLDEPSPSVDAGSQEAPHATSSAHDAVSPISSSHFAARFQRHTSHLGVPRPAASVPTSAQQTSPLTAAGYEPDSAAQGASAAFVEAQSERRALFADAPTVRLRKSAAQLRTERQFLDRMNSLEGSSLRRTKPRGAEAHVDIPLLPAEYLRRRAAESVQSNAKSLTSTVASLTNEDGAEQLHFAAARNALQQSDEVQMFRCLRCFHVFDAKPSTILASQVDQPARIEVAAIAAKKKQAMIVSKVPSLRKKLHSVARQRHQFASDPHCCPQCTSQRVQWMTEYVHHNLHGRQRK